MKKKELVDHIIKSHCDEDYDICLKYIQECCDDLNIDSLSQMDYYLIGKDNLKEMALECFKKKKENMENSE